MVAHVASAGTPPLAGRGARVFALELGRDLARALDLGIRPRYQGEAANDEKGERG
jgi:hypothetical protein